MSDEKNLDLEQFAGLAELIELRLRRALTGGSGRAGGVTPRPAASPALDRWKDGSPKDREEWLLECGVGGQPFDERRFELDNSYSSRADVQAAASQLVEIRRAKRQREPHPETRIEVPEGTPKAIADAMQSQEGFEKARAGLTKAERLAEIEQGIAALEARRQALEGGEE